GACARALGGHARAAERGALCGGARHHAGDRADRRAREPGPLAHLAPPDPPGARGAAGDPRAHDVRERHRDPGRLSHRQGLARPHLRRLRVRRAILLPAARPVVLARLELRLRLRRHSGVGKSVRMTTSNGRVGPDWGDVIVAGLYVPRLGRKEIQQLRSRIGYVFQYGALFDSMSVAENIRLGITDEACASDEAYCTNRVRDCLRLVNLAPDVAEKYPAELSGGVRKRVGIARAIAGKPKYL